MHRKLRFLHNWNAWVLALLAVSGIVLFAPALRAQTAPIRVALKEGHLWLGAASAILLLLYLPFLPKHLRQLRGKHGQRVNLAVMLALTAGWCVSGTILWLERSVPPFWTSAALLAHDWLTWIGVPYALYHAVTRSRWIRERRTSAADAANEEEAAAVRSYHAYDGTRRRFLLWTVASGAALLVGPAAYRWLKRFGDGEGMTAADIPSRSAGAAGNEQAMAGQELLTPAPESAPPVGGGAQGRFRIYTVAPIPKFDPANWKFSVRGLVERELEYDWPAFAKLARKVQVSDFHCVTGWSVYRATWEGIPLKELLAAAGIAAGAKYVKFYSGDGAYTDALTLEQAQMDDVLVAALIDGKPLPEDLGGPVRLIVPRMYAYKSVKWLQSVELIDKEHIGFWEERGYDTDAWVPGAEKV